MRSWRDAKKIVFYFSTLTVVWSVLSGQPANAASEPISSYAQYNQTTDLETSQSAELVLAQARQRPPGMSRAGGPAIDVWAQRVTLSGDHQQTEFVLELSAGVVVEVFTLANPYRVVIDMPQVQFRLPSDAGRKGKGLIKAFRYGLFSQGKARVVIDTTAPVRITKAEMTRVSASGRAVNLVLALTPTDAKSFGRGTGADRSSQKQKKKSAAPEEMLVLPERKPRGKQTKPMIVIDPGHGGIDPGALGPSKVYEKLVVLSVAKRLRQALKATGRFRVTLTRSTDVFVSLDQRLQFSRKKGADLFISLHADSLAQKNLAHSVRGATVYTLSEKASDEQARLAAEKENSSDLLAGLQTDDGDGSSQVRDILLDLMKRETANFSLEFSGALIRQLRKSIFMRRTPRRSAAFKVLKQTHAPSVLIELGYLSNPTDEGLLRSANWQKKVAAAITRAIDIYFKKK